MKVSILMCAYNASAYIDRAISSILNQTWQDWELIISDDASTDNTVEIIKPYLTDNRIRLITHVANLGYLKNKNTAFVNISGDLITQIDADDTCSTERIEKQVKVFLEHPNIKICATNYRRIGMDDNEIESAHYENDFVISEIMDDYPFWFPGVMFKKELINEFGLFSEYFSGIFGDDEYWIARVNYKYPIYFLKDVLYNYRVHPDSMTNVFDNPRKMIAAEILNELKRQIKNTGTDDIALGHPEKMKAFEQGVFNNSKLMAEKYRRWAATAIDGKRFSIAKKLIKRSFQKDKTNFTTYRTLFYLFKASVLAK